MIPKNAITMVGDITQCWLFAYRVPQNQLKPLLPEPLRLVTKGDFGFINIVVSELAHMRPLGLPAFLGFHYWHVAYRLPVWFQPSLGASSLPQIPLKHDGLNWRGESDDAAIEGLYFLRSDANSRLMVAAGKVLTDFQFHWAEVKVLGDEDRWTIDVASQDAHIHALLSEGKDPILAKGSPFRSLEEAAQFLKYKPAGISVDGRRVDVLRIVRDEQAWRSKQVHVDDAEFEFLKPFDAEFEICYKVEPIHYRWNRAVRYLGGVIESEKKKAH